MAAELTLTDVARSISVSPATLRRWVVDGIVPLRDGQWTPAALAQARIVARMRHRGHGLDQLRRAAKEGRLAYGYLEDLFPKPEAEYHLDDAVRETGLEPELIRRIWSAAGFSEASLDTSPTTTSRCYGGSRRCSTPGSHSSPSCSSCACTGWRSRRWPTPRSSSSTSSCTSR